MFVGRFRFVVAAVAVAVPFAVAGCGADPGTGLVASAGTSTTGAPVTTAPPATIPKPPVNAALTTDAAALSAAASEFSGISSELKSQLSQVDSTAGDLAGSLAGPAGTAAQAALARFRDAATKQVQQLNDISQNINQAGVQYQQAADDAASSLSSGMGFRIHGVSLKRAQGPAQDSHKYNFAGIQAAAGQIQGSVSQVQGLLDQGGQCLQRLSPVWGGAGSDAYQQTIQRWGSSAAELNAALQDLAVKVSEAGTAMQQTENNVSGMFN